MILGTMMAKGLRKLKDRGRSRNAGISRDASRTRHRKGKKKKGNSVL
jgi:hypothetical protein